MAKRISAQRALELILEEREARVEGVSSTLEDEEFSKYEDHVSVESDSEFEEEDEIDHQPAPRPARQQLAPRPAQIGTEGNSRGDCSFSRSWAGHC